MVTYESAKEILLSNGIFVLEKKRPIQEVKYLINCGYTLLYSVWAPKISPMLQQGYIPIRITDITLSHISDEDLYDEIKRVSYHPQTVINYVCTYFLNMKLKKENIFKVKNNILV